MTAGVQIAQGLTPTTRSRTPRVMSSRAKFDGDLEVQTSGAFGDRVFVVPMHPGLASAASHGHVANVRPGRAAS